MSRWMVAGCLGAALLLAAGVVRARLKPEPRYLGRSASHWVQDLDHTNGAVRAQAMVALKHLGPDAVPPLVKALKIKRSRLARIFFPGWQHSSWFAFSRLNPARTQLRASRALREIGPHAASAVVELFEDSDPAVQQAAVETLGAMGPSVMPLVLKSIRHPQPRARFCAALTLSRFGAASAPALPALSQTLRDSEPSVRAAAAAALAEMGPEAAAAVPQLVRVLRDPDYSVRCGAVAALDRIGPPAYLAVPALIGLLESRDEVLRLDLIQALGKIGPGAAAATPVLEPGLRDSNIVVRLETARALWRIRQDAGETVPILLELMEGNGLVFRCRTIEVLEEIGPPARAAVPVLVTLLNTSPPHDDRYAAAALRQIDPELAAKVLPNRPGYRGRYY